MDIYKFFISYSKSVQGQSTLTHLQEESIVTVAMRQIWIFGAPSHLCLPVAMVTILSEFHKDSLAFLSYDSFLLDGEREDNDFREKEVGVSHVTKTSKCSSPLGVAVPHVS